MNILSLPDLKALAKSGGALPPDAAIRKDFAILERAVDGDAYTADFTITTDEVDRHGDTVSASGWKLDRYLPGNPILCWQHDYDIPPIGRCLSITQDGSRLVARFQFDAADPFARKIFSKVQGGFISAVSVGFIPLAFDWSDEPGREFGWDITAAELLEVSVVGIPANASALIERRAAPEPDSMMFTKEELDLIVSQLRRGEPVAATAEESSVVPTLFLAGSRKRAERLRMHSFFHRSFI